MLQPEELQWLLQGAHKANRATQVSSAAPRLATQLHRLSAAGEWARFDSEAETASMLSVPACPSAHLEATRHSLMPVAAAIWANGVMEASSGSEVLRGLRVHAENAGWPLQVLSYVVMHANVPSIQRADLDEQLVTFVNTVGACERIQKTPIPLPYTS